MYRVSNSLTVLVTLGYVFGIPANLVRGIPIDIDKLIHNNKHTCIEY